MSRENLLPQATQLTSSEGAIEAAAAHPISPQELPPAETSTKASPIPLPFLAFLDALSKQHQGEQEEEAMQQELAALQAQLAALLKDVNAVGAETTTLNEALAQQAQQKQALEEASRHFSAQAEANRKAEKEGLAYLYEENAKLEETRDSLSEEVRAQEARLHGLQYTTQQRKEKRTLLETEVDELHQTRGNLLQAHQVQQKSNAASQAAVSKWSMRNSALEAQIAKLITVKKETEGQIFLQNEIAAEAQKQTKKKKTTPKEEKTFERDGLASTCNMSFLPSQKTNWKTAFSVLQQLEKAGKCKEALAECTRLLASLDPNGIHLVYKADLLLRKANIHKKYPPYSNKEVQALYQEAIAIYHSALLASENDAEKKFTLMCTLLLNLLRSDAKHYVTSANCMTTFSKLLLEKPPIHTLAPKIQDIAWEWFCLLQARIQKEDPETVIASTVSASIEIGIFKSIFLQYGIVSEKMDLLFSSAGFSEERPGLKSILKKAMVSRLKKEGVVLKKAEDKNLEMLCCLALSNDLYTPIVWVGVLGGLNLSALTLLRQSKQHKQWSSIPPLHAAAVLGKTETMRALLELGFDIAQQVGEEKRTPLHYAVLAEQVESVRFLCAQRMGSLSTQDVEGKTAKTLAEEKDIQEIVSLLKEAEKNAASEAGLPNAAALQENIQINRHMTELTQAQSAITTEITQLNKEVTRLTQKGEKRRDKGRLDAIRARAAILAAEEKRIDVEIRTTYEQMLVNTAQINTVHKNDMSAAVRPAPPLSPASLSVFESLRPGSTDGSNARSAGFKK